MPTVTLSDAQAHLPQILVGRKPGEEVVIAEHGQPLVRLVRTERTT